MTKRLVALLAVTLAALLVGACDTGAASFGHRQAVALDCPSDPRPDFTPRQEGPLRLARVQCHGWPSSSFGITPPAVSPDGRSIAGSGDGVDLGLFAGRIQGDARFRIYPVNPTSFGFMSGGSRFRWDRGAEAIWTSTQPKTKPSGWATGPVQPLLALAGGTLKPLPVPTSSAGPLDALTWIDDQGLALAQFGTRGAYYRPAHPDPSPSLAFVDMKRGKVLDEAPLAQFMPGAPKGATAIGLNVAAMHPRGGKPVALIRTMSSWVLWTQGQPPRRIADPWRDASAVSVQVGLTFAPDGRAVLVSQKLGTLTSCSRDGRCVAGPAERGKAASLVDLASGAVLWSIQGEGIYGADPPTPAFSPDGRLMLIDVPRGADGVRVLVVSTADGKVLQDMPTPGSLPYAMGFTAAGDRAWISCGGRTAFYDVARL